MQGQLPYKILFLGPSKCGKTSFLQCLANKKYVQSQNYFQTIGVDFITKKIQINQKNAKFINWDTSGNQKYEIMNKTYYKCTSIFIFMFDLSDIYSFKSLKIRVKSPDFNEFMKCNTKDSKSPLTLLIGSKCDLQQKVPDFQIQKISKNFTLYMKTSSKTGENVENAIQNIAQIKVNGTPYEWNVNFDEQQQNLNQLSIKSQQNAAPGGIQQIIDQKIIKIMMVGPHKSGKTSILHSYFDKVFQEAAYKSTIGADFKMKSISYKDTEYKIQVWDTAGQQRFRVMSSALFKGVTSIYIIYDCTNQNQFKNLPKYLKQIEQYSVQPVYVCLAGTKSDLIDKKKVSTQEGMQFATQNEIDFMEVSSIQSQQNKTVDALFQRGIEWFYKNKQK